MLKVENDLKETMAKADQWFEKRHNRDEVANEEDVEIPQRMSRQIRMECENKASSCQNQSVDEAASRIHVEMEQGDGRDEPEDDIREEALQQEQVVDFTRTICAWFLHVACELSKGNERMGKESQSFESGWSVSRNVSSQL